MNFIGPSVFMLMNAPFIPGNLVYMEDLLNEKEDKSTSL